MAGGAAYGEADGRAARVGSVAGFLDASSAAVRDIEAWKLEMALDDDGAAGGRQRHVAGLGTTRKHLKGTDWDDTELARLANMLEGGSELLQLESLEVSGMCGASGVRALARALLVCGDEVLWRSFQLKAHLATDEELLLLAAALRCRTDRSPESANGEARNQGATVDSAGVCGGGGGGGGGRSGSSDLRPLLAAPYLRYVRIEGGPHVTRAGHQAIEALRRSRASLPPPPPTADEVAAKAAADARARVAPSPLRKFLSPLECVDARRAEHAERRRVLFKAWDARGAGCLSLAQIGSGVLGLLTNAHGAAGEALYKRYYRCFGTCTRVRTPSHRARVSRKVRARDDACPDCVIYRNGSTRIRRRQRQWLAQLQQSTRKLRYWRQRRRPATAAATSLEAQRLVCDATYLSHATEQAAHLCSVARGIHGHRRRHRGSHRRG